METIQTANRPKCVASILAASALILGGVALAVCFFGLIPGSTDITVGKFLLFTLAVLLPLVSGSVWLGVLRMRGRARGRFGYGNGLGFGLLLITAGFLILGFSSGLLPAQWRPILISWPMLLIVFGLFETGKVHMIPGLTFLFLGIFFMIPRVAQAFPDSWMLAENFTATYWPMLLIALGVLIILSLTLQRVFLNGKYYCAESRGKGRVFDGMVKETHADGGYIDYNLVFTGSEQVVLAPEFKGGQINTVFGGMKLDLRRTNLQEGTTYLKVESVFGGVSIYAPGDWNIDIRNTSSVFGGFNDNRARVEPNKGDDRRLVIIASCVFGGGEIR